MGHHVHNQSFCFLIVALKMDDTHRTFGGFILRPDSEYLSVFNYYFLKAFETGVFYRLDKLVYNADEEPPLKIGITEPGPLEIKNVMFPFSSLGIVMIISVVIAVVEMCVPMSKSSKERALFKQRIQDGGQQITDQVKTVMRVGQEGI